MDLRLATQYESKKNILKYEYEHEQKSVGNYVLNATGG
jgi:hypothetical protein